MDNMEELLAAVQDQSRSTMKRWFDKVPGPCMQFLIRVAQDHKAGKLANPTALSRVLYDNFQVKITAKTAQTWLKEVENNEWPREK